MHLKSAALILVYSVSSVAYSIYLAEYSCKKRLDCTIRGVTHAVPPLRSFGLYAGAWVASSLLISGAMASNRVLSGLAITERKALCSVASCAPLPAQRSRRLTWRNCVKLRGGDLILRERQAVLHGPWGPVHLSHDVPVELRSGKKSIMVIIRRKRLRKGVRYDDATRITDPDGECGQVKFI